MPPWRMLLLSLLLAGCEQRLDQALLQQRLVEMAARPGGSMEALPHAIEYEAFTYAAASLRSPFERPQLAATAAGVRAPGSVQPDLERRSEALEAFDLDSLRMVGMMRSGNRVLALVQDNTGLVHRVGVGNYLGRNHGRVLAASGEQLQLMEIVPSGDGGWVERPRALSLLP